MGLLREHADAVASGERSSAELVAEAVGAAERLQPALNAFTTIFADEAMAAAFAADEAVTGGGTLAPLHGVPVAVKELYDIAGFTTTGCTRAYRGLPPARLDAAAVAALRRAGAIVIGKTNMHELAFGATSSVSSHGPVNNPWDPERMSGGSSGGSAAAVAARVVGLALGSDTGGSIRIPSSFCGVSGLKTTNGLLPLDGVLPMSPSLDTVGPIATDAEDLALAFFVLGGQGAFWSGYRPESLRRVGVPTDYFFDAVDDEVAAAVRAAASVFTAERIEVRPVPALWAADAHDAWLTVALAEFLREHRSLLDRTEDVSPEIAVILHAAASLSADDERDARDRIAAARGLFERSFEEVDLLLAPATPVTAPRHTDQTVTAGGRELPVHLGAPSTLTRPVSSMGAPAVAVPCGASAAGLPIGLQLIGPAGSEALLLGAAALYQSRTDWHRRVPPLHA